MEKIKIVEIVEGGFGVVEYKEIMMEVGGDSFEENVDIVFNKLMEDMDEEFIENEMGYMEGIVNRVGVIRMGEGIDYYVLDGSNEWSGKDCKNEEFYDYVMDVVLNMEEEE